MASVLVTGGSGFIGTHLCKQLHSSGYHVLSLDVNHDSEHPWECISADVRSQIDLEGIDFVVHLAAQISVAASLEDPDHTLSVNVDGTASVITAAEEGLVKRLIFASSAAVYGDAEQIPIPEGAPLTPQSPYAVSKIVGEELCRRSKIETCAMRFFNVYGEGQSAAGGYAAVIPAFKSAISQGEIPKVFGDGTQIRDFIHVEDLAAIIVAALEIEDLPPEMNLASGTGTSLLQLLDTLGAEKAEFMDERPGDIHTSIADVSLMQQVFPDIAVREIEEGLS